MLEPGSIDIPLTFDMVRYNSVSYQSVHLIHATFQSNCAEGLHFSAFFIFIIIIIATILFVYFSSYNMSCAEMTSKVGVAHKISRALTRAIYFAGQSWIRP